MFGKEKIFGMALLLAAALSAERPAPLTPVSNVIFTAFDTETTGFSTKNDRIVEIGAVRFLGAEILASTNWLINPGMPVPFYATEVHGITTEMLAPALGFAEVFSQFAEFCEGSVLLAHNAAFDAGFLRAELERAGLAPPALLTGDTLPLFRCWFPAAESHSLERLALYLGVQGGTYHRAEADSYHIINILNAGLKQRTDLSFQRLERDAGGFKQLDGGKP